MGNKGAARRSLLHVHCCVCERCAHLCKHLMKVQTCCQTTQFWIWKQNYIHYFIITSIISGQIIQLLVIFIGSNEACTQIPSGHLFKHNNANSTVTITERRNRCWDHLLFSSDTGWEKSSWRTPRFESFTKMLKMNNCNKVPNERWGLGFTAHKKTSRIYFWKRENYPH